LGSRGAGTLDGEHAARCSAGDVAQELGRLAKDVAHALGGERSAEGGGNIDQLAGDLDPARRGGARSLVAVALTVKSTG
jgi:hypothetical protein